MDNSLKKSDFCINNDRIFIKFSNDISKENYIREAFSSKKYNDVIIEEIRYFANEEFNEYIEYLTIGEENLIEY